MYTLFYKPTCPFCQKVLAYAEQNDIQFTLKNIEEGDEIVEELLTLGGKRQVPFLVDDEDSTKLYESDDIITYLKEKK